jgi:hypothetical protein
MSASGNHAKGKERPLAALRRIGGVHYDLAMDDVWALINDPASTEAGLRILRARVAERPSDPKAAFDLASAYDMLDREADAELAYEQVRKLGLGDLTPHDRSRWYIQFGSTLRLCGKTDESRTVLAEGEAAFPEDTVIAAFRALTELAAGSPKKATRVLLDGVLRSSNPQVDFYRRALTHYARELAGEP